MKPKSRFLYSITIQLLLAIFLLLLPFVFLSVYINHSFMQSGLRQIEQSHTRLLESYMAQIDREFELAENYMNDLVHYNSTSVYLTDRSSASFYYAANSIDQDITKNSLYYQYVSGVFIYVPDSGFYYTHMLDANALAQENAIKVYITGEMADKRRVGWHDVMLDGDTYLIQGYYSNGIYGGAFLRLESLPVMWEGQVNDVAFCLNGQLEDISTGSSILLSAGSARNQLCVYEIFDRQEAHSALPLLLRYLQVITAFFLLLIPLVFVSLRWLLIRPLHRLIGAMRQLESGDLDTQIIGEAHTREFQQIDHTFNRMVQQIRHLKIAVYEEQLQTEKIKLQNLSYQLRPHFMVNSLNMAYNMIVSGDHSSATRLMRFSANYMRHLLSIRDDFIPLNEELSHLQDYIGIQLLRYEGQFKYETVIEPFVEDVLIPNMVLQNFIENSIKYSIGPDHVTTIHLSAGYCEVNGEPSAAIVVRDDGGGYPEWLLEAFQSEDWEALRDRVGLRNTIQRIQMLYGERAQCQFYNDGGAVSRFVFPLEINEDTE